MELNPIACDSCRVKKCKCDRQLPKCSSCRNASLVCRYQEGGRRGLPIAYINTLERRLQETEAALYAAIVALDDPSSIRSSDISSLKASRELSKLERQEEWKQLPLQTSKHLSAWFEHKQSEAISLESELPHIPFPGTATVTSQSAISPNNMNGSPMDLGPMSTTPRADGTSPMDSDSVLSASSRSVHRQLRDTDPPRAPNTSMSPSRSSVWHNYF